MIPRTTSVRSRGAHIFRGLSSLALITACSTVRQPATDTASDNGNVLPSPLPSQIAARQDSAILVGAGDIAACELKGARKTAQLLDSIPGIVFVAGDAAYGSAKVPNPFVTCYDSTWGRHKERTRPVLGNHDYEVTGLPMFFDYFGAQAGPRPDGYYSFDAGAWHIMALNSNIAMSVNSPEYKWFRADLSAHRGQCAMAFMHHPRWSSGPHDGKERMIPFWELLAKHGASVMVAGHDHLYERFRPMNNGGGVDSVKGVREFIVGTGGGGHYPLGKVERGSEVRNDNTYGVLKLTLRPTDYSWEFIPVHGSTFHDSGTSRCHPLT